MFGVWLVVVSMVALLAGLAWSARKSVRTGRQALPHGARCRRYHDDDFPTGAGQDLDFEAYNAEQFKAYQVRRSALRAERLAAYRQQQRAQAR